MRFVVDASVALKLVLSEPGSETAEKLFAGQDELLLPDFWLSEATSVMWREVYRRKMTADEAYEGLERLIALGTVPTGKMNLHPLALSMAVDVSHSPYDLLYMAFTMEAKADKLIVEDAKFTRAMRGSPLGMLLMMTLDEWQVYHG